MFEQVNTVLCTAVLYCNFIANNCCYILYMYLFIYIYIYIKNTNEEMTQLQFTLQYTLGCYCEIHHTQSGSQIAPLLVLNQTEIKHCLPEFHMRLPAATNNALGFLNWLMISSNHFYNFLL